MICLSFDTDHMDEARMAQFLAQVRIPGAGTFFCTQPYGCLEATHHEIAPHPFLAEGEPWEAELERHRAQFPDALGWRAHACIFSHGLAERIAKAGYLYASTHDDLGRPDLRPHRHAWGVWHLPIYYMDNLDFSARRFWPERKHRPFERKLIDQAVDGAHLYVFDFHPIHLMLNSPDAEFYLQARDRFRAGEDIGELRCSGYGTASFFSDLCRAMQERNLESLRMVDALRAFIGDGPR
jgi:hypothetical protein